MLFSEPPIRIFIEIGMSTVLRASTISFIFSGRFSKAAPEPCFRIRSFGQPILKSIISQSVASYAILAACFIKSVLVPNNWTDLGFSSGIVANKFKVALLLLAIALTLIIGIETNPAPYSRHLNLKAMSVMPDIGAKNSLLLNFIFRT